MHIPDGWISPSTAVVMYAAATPFWYVAARRVKRALTHRMVPLLSLFAALSFAVMMFNIPLPGATTGHVTGGAIVAVVLGPWASVLALSVVLVIQAVFFGDGGILAIGANCFNIAVALPLVAYAVYQILSLGSDITSGRRVWAAAIGAYVGLNAAALLTAVEIGVQPMLFTEAGHPLYSPYDLSQAVPVMFLTHALIIGPLEAVITGLAVAYLQRSHLPVLKLNTPTLATTAKEARGTL
ncbi:MAG: cobalt transporter CbiM [Chloroflexota bacterium]